MTIIYLEKISLFSTIPYLLYQRTSILYEAIKNLTSRFCYYRIYVRLIFY